MLPFRHLLVPKLCHSADDRASPMTPATRLPPPPSPRCRDASLTRMELRAMIESHSRCRDLSRVRRAGKQSDGRPPLPPRRFIYRSYIIITRRTLTRCAGVLKARVARENRSIMEGDLPAIYQPHSFNLYFTFFPPPRRRRVTGERISSATGSRLFTRITFFTCVPRSRRPPRARINHK